MIRKIFHTKITKKEKNTKGNLIDIVLRNPL